MNTDTNPLLPYLRSRVTQERIGQLADAGANVLEIIMLGSSVTIRTAVALPGRATPVPIAYHVHKNELNSGLFTLCQRALELRKDGARRPADSQPLTPQGKSPRMWKGKKERETRTR